MTEYVCENELMQISTSVYTSASTKNEQHTCNRGVCVSPQVLSIMIPPLANRFPKLDHRRSFKCDEW